MDMSNFKIAVGAFFREREREFELLKQQDVLMYLPCTRVGWYHHTVVRTRRADVFLCVYIEFYICQYQITFCVN
jgi:hypothetical protein